MKKQFAVFLGLASFLVVAFAASSTLNAQSTGLVSAILDRMEVNRANLVGDLPAPPAIGTVIDDFTLPDADGASHSLASLKGKNGTVLIFIATKCPVSNGYNDRMQKLSEDYKAKGFNVIGVNANNTEPAAEVKSHAAEKGLKFTILKDDGNKIADRLGATKTPEAYVIDTNGKLAYHGRIDNSLKTEAITSNDLREALDEMLAGKPVSKTGGAAFGCTIKRVS